MPTDCISYQNSGYFTQLIVDYLDEKPELRNLYNRFPNLHNFKDQINFHDMESYNNHQNILKILTHYFLYLECYGNSRETVPELTQWQSRGAEGNEINA